MSHQPRQERSPGDPAAISAMAADGDLRRLSSEWMQCSARHGYTYNFTWLGVPIIQHPEDIVAVHELIWSVAPDLVIETGIAHGGSVLLSASVLRLLGGDREVLGIDIDIREHTRRTLRDHALADHISTIEGSSIAPGILAQAAERAAAHQRVLVILDSNHTEDHVTQELEAYAPLVSEGSYLVVMDTVVESLPGDLYSDRPWGPGDNPATAVRRFLAGHPEFVEDRGVADRLLLSVAPGGYLRRREAAVSDPSTAP
jgi:cephalosporin hydroxylase